MIANLLVVESEKLLATIARRIRFVLANGGDGDVLVILRLNRDPVVKTTTDERVAA